MKYILLVILVILFVAQSKLRKTHKDYFNWGGSEGCLERCTALGGENVFSRAIWGWQGPYRVRTNKYNCCVKGTVTKQPDIENSKGGECSQLENRVNGCRG